MSSLFQDAEEQFIDANGKTRILNYETVSLIVSPLPPLDLKRIISKKANDIPVYEATFNDAIDFIKNKGLEITEKDGNPDQGIQGLWVRPKTLNMGITKGYIPIDLIPDPESLKKVDYVRENQHDPIRTDGKTHSLLEKYRKSEKIAYYLKQYALFSYSLAKKEGKGFDEKNFKIDPNHIYDVSQLGQKFYKKGNNVIYSSSGRMIVTTETVRDKLLSYLRVKLSLDEPGVLSLSDSHEMSNYYQKASDFRSSQNNLVFSGKEALERWMEEKEKVKTKIVISQRLDADTLEPYYYKSSHIEKDRLAIIQNTEEGTLEMAKTVSIKWIKDKVNIGYNPNIPSSIKDVKHATYTDMGKVTKTKKGETYAPVILYEDGTYGAILFLR